MNRQDLEALLHRGRVHVKFEKKTTKSLRDMECTLHPSHMPPPPEKPSKTLPAHLLLVWDLESEGLRSFDVEDLVEEPYLVEEYKDAE